MEAAGKFGVAEYRACGASRLFWLDPRLWEEEVRDAPLSTMLGAMAGVPASASEDSFLSMGLPGPSPLDFPAS